MEEKQRVISPRKYSNLTHDNEIYQIFIVNTVIESMCQIDAFSYIFSLKESDQKLKC